MTEIPLLLTDAVRRCLDVHGYFSNEDGRRAKEDKIDLQSALVEQLGASNCERELAATFASAARPPPSPPEHMGPAKDVCAVKGPSRRVDLLWHDDQETVAIELKLRRITEWSGTYVCTGST